MLDRRKAFKYYYYSLGYIIENTLKPCRGKLQSGGKSSTHKLLGTFAQFWDLLLITMTFVVTFLTYCNSLTVVPLDHCSCLTISKDFVRANKSSNILGLMNDWPFKDF